MSDNKVLLPETEFPLRGDPENQQTIAKHWEGLEERCAKLRENAEPFVLHDGPPYANGDIHMGHALNKVHKDFINRREYQKGKKVLFVPGWDCHGLPIETGVEKSSGTHGLSVNQIRAKCREYANHWVDVQKQSFIDLGIRGTFDKPYLTMDHSAEIVILENFYKLVKLGLVYRAKRPVLWSCAECTSLAEAELEYQEKKSTAVHVQFKVTEGKWKDTIVPIWTTTPWTLFANEAVAVAPDKTYLLILADARKIWIAEDLMSSLISKLNLDNTEIITKVQGSELENLQVLNPIKKIVPVLPADFVTTEEGTGFVHIAPAHGPDDFTLGRKYNLPITDAITERGKLLYPELNNAHFAEADNKICEFFADIIMAKEVIIHNYPCSWRSKAPLVYRATYQWFISIEKIRNNALEGIEKVEWVPAVSKNRIRSMVSNRPDWCISRQRCWGVPLAIFYNQESGEIRTEFLDSTLEYLRKNGIDAWFEHAQALCPSDAVPVMDIMDVWLESGLTNKILQDLYPEINFPVDLYLEGSDQHRGWFQSSLVLSCAEKPNPPFKKVVTQGFIVDKNGRKMSKSLGNGVDPKSIKEVDVLRLTLLMVSAEEDVRYNEETVKRARDILARFRLTLRYTLGNLTTENLEHINYYPLEQWVLSRMTAVNKEWRKLTHIHKPELGLKLIYDFCHEDLSAFYFDIRKDLIYCDDKNNPERLSAIKCMDVIFNCVVRWLSPAVPFLAEEAWQYYPKKYGSVHELDEMKIEARNTDLELRYASARELRSEIYCITEKLRVYGIIKASHDASVEVGAGYNTNEFSEQEMKELCIASDFKYSKNCSEIKVNPHPGDRCARCKFRGELFDASTANSECTGMWCKRCISVVRNNHISKP